MQIINPTELNCGGKMPVKSRVLYYPFYIFADAKAPAMFLFVFFDIFHKVADSSDGRVKLVGNADTELLFKLD